MPNIETGGYEPQNKRTEILNKAIEIVNGDRQNDYGPPQVNFERIAKFWSVYLGGVLAEDLTARQVSDMMILLKTARSIHSPTEDTYADIAGYAALGSELSIVEKEQSLPVNTGNTPHVWSGK